MQINKLIFILFLMLMSSLVSVSVYAENNPSVLLQNIADNMIAGLKANQATLKTKPEIVYQLANKYVVPHAALPLMARHVLPPQVWNHSSPDQRLQFMKEFTTTLIRTYSSALSSYHDQKVRIFPIRGALRTTVEVHSEITSTEHEPIHVTYRLVHVGTAWELFDLSVEGVSMLESFRAQFADILSQGNMELLLKRMGGHNRRTAA